MTSHTMKIQSALNATCHTPERQSVEATYQDAFMPFITNSEANLAEALADYEEDAKRILTSFVMRYASAKRPSQNALHADCVSAFIDNNKERVARGLHQLEHPKRGRFRGLINSLDDIHCMMARYGVELTVRHARFLSTVQHQSPQVGKALRALADLGSNHEVTLTNGMVTGFKPSA